MRRTYIRQSAVSLCFLGTFITCESVLAEQVEFPIGREQSLEDITDIKREQNIWQPIFELPLCPFSWCGNIKLKVEHKYSHLPQVLVV